MNVNVTVAVCLGMFWVKNIHLIKLLSTLRAIFKHCTHSRIAVYISVFTFYIIILSGFKSKVFIYLHQLCVHFPYFSTFCSVQNEFLSGSCMTAFNKNFFNGVLYMFNGWIFAMLMF